MANRNAACWALLYVAKISPVDANDVRPGAATQQNCVGQAGPLITSGDKSRR